MATNVAAPHWLLALLEAPRALTEASTLVAARKLLQNLLPGDGHPVLILPGFLASDRSTRVLRRYIYDWGYDSFRWRLGRNLGPSRQRNLDALLDERLLKLFKETGRRVSIVGWSLGGLYARELARRNPEAVRNVITLGSPHGDPKATNAWRLYEALSGIRVDDDEIRSRLVDLRSPLHNVPVTAIYSRTDAIVSSSIAKLPPGNRTENIGLSTSHIGMGFNPLVLYLVADRLRQPADEWTPFEFTGLRNFFYHS